MNYAAAIKAAKDLTNALPFLGSRPSRHDFAKFNARVASIPSGVALLRTLMDQYQLTQSDFENEIGKKSLVSRILNGQRTLTLDHMRALAKRFNLPVIAFVGK